MASEAPKRPALRLGRIAVAAVLLAVAAGAALVLLPGRRLAEAWLLAFVLLAGIAAGSLAAVWIGRLLGRRWLTPLDDELIPAGYTLPLVLVIGLPLAVQADALVASWAVPDRLSFWFDPAFVAVRTLLYLLLWTALGFALTRPGQGMRSAGLGLVLLVPSVAMAGIDWVLPRGPFWWSSIFGFAFAASQLPPALALAFLVNRYQREAIEIAEDRSLVSALIAASLAMLWLWFVQYLAAFMANLPDEAAWYQARLIGVRWIPLAGAALALAAAVLLLLQRGRGRGFVIAGSGLILLQHVLHTAWLLRPAPTPALGLPDLAVLLVLIGLWFAALWTALDRQDRLAEAQPPGRPGSS